MCYICGKSSGHEVGCPFAETETIYLTCRECGDDGVAEWEAYEKDGKTCMCSVCYFKEEE
jgi:hypothetical protein